MVKVGIVFTMLGGAIALLMFGSDASDALVYSKLVDEVLTDPAQFRGRELRVEGDLVQGSIKFKDSQIGMMAQHLLNLWRIVGSIKRGGDNPLEITSTCPRNNKENSRTR